MTAKRDSQSFDRRRVSLGLGFASVAALGGAVFAAVHGYSPDVGGCPDGTPAPLAFWPLLVAGLAAALAAFAARPRQRNERGQRTGADVFALFLVWLMPVALVLTALGEMVTYACWE